MKRIFAVLLIAAAVMYTIQSAPADNKECPSFCALVWAPICASNGTCFRQFDNQCMMDIENCKNTTITRFDEKHSGSCTEKSGETLCTLPTVKKN